MAPDSRADRILLEAVDLADQAVSTVADPGTVGSHLEAVTEGERLVTHYFACASPAYRGWRWSVTLARAPRQKYATVCETALVPGAGALLAPAWLPYADRITPGDLAPGDVLPHRAADPLLEDGFSATGEPEVDDVALDELCLGRRRVLSPAGRAAAAQRWYDGEHGPQSEMAEKAPARCQTCGYLVPMAGALRRCFGVCANEYSPSDGTVVSYDHGCGAHSEAQGRPEPSVVVPEPILDEYAVELVERP